MKFALVSNGIVINVSEWDGDITKWDPALLGYDAIQLPDDTDVSAGHEYDGATFTPPKAEIPVKDYSLDKAVKALLAKGLLVDSDFD